MNRHSSMPPRGNLDPVALVHALEVHQAELVLQNQELLDANAELERSNGALAAARDHYRALHQLAPAPLVTVDPRGVIVDVNRAAELILRASRNELIDRRFALCVAEAARPAFAALLDKVFTSGALHDAGLVLTAGDAEPIVVTVDGVAIEEEGRPRAVLAFVDVSEQRRAEAERRARAERAEAAQRLESLGVLAGGIAHDFNNLLTVILAGTDHVLHTLPAGSEAATTLVDVRQGARQAAVLAHQMLAYSGRASAPSRVLELGPMIRGLAPLLRAAAQITPLTLDLPVLPRVFGDEAQLRQVVLNLVTNAAEAMHGRPGAITIAARTEDATEALGLVGERCVVLEIRDHGDGMDAATQARMFDPYFSTKFVGRGLGLAVVQGIVRGHHGAIAVTSTPGQGTSFRIYLPAVPAAAVSASPASLPWRGTGTILLVEDDHAVSIAFARILRHLGFAVVTAADGAEALEVFAAERAAIDVVFMDLTMPRMGGVEASRALHALSPELPIVLTTGFGELPPDAGREFVAVLPKPFDLTAVLHVLRPLTRSD